MMTLQRLPMPLYAFHAGAKSSARFGDLESRRRNSAPILAGAFFVPAMRYGGCAWETARSAGFLLPRFANLRTAAPILFGDSRDGSTAKGVTPMAQLRLSNLITRNLSSRAAAHRAMAKAALFADSSTRTRLNRYNHHIEKAQQFEARLAGQQRQGANA